MNAITDPYVLHQASCRASLLVATAGFTSDDWEDLRQEIVLDLIRRAPKFDPERGNWHGFVRGVARHHSTILIAGHRRRTREVLGEDLKREDAHVGDSADALDKCPGSNPVVELDLRLDVQRVVARLPPHLRSLANLLGQMPVKELCQYTGKSRPTVYRMTLQIKEAFFDAGLAPCNRLRNGRKSPSRESSERSKGR
jgi:RNA polymerase sigma-70 factor, ECF subfamily